LKMYAPMPPELSGQEKITASLTITEAANLKSHNIVERTAARRPLIELDFPTNTAQLKPGVNYHLEYSGTLNALKIHLGKPPKPLVPITKEERRLYLSTSPTLDYTAPAFVTCCKNAGLIRKHEEDITAFAARVFKALVAHGTYDGAQGTFEARRPSNTCKTLATDSTGFSLFFTGVMRANGIPARTLFGRWSLRPPEGFDVKNHAISEFYVPDTGWVPVDVAGTIVAKPKDPLALFGNTSGQLIIMHIDTDVELATGITRPWVDGFVPQWTGPATFWNNLTYGGNWQDQQTPIRKPPATATAPAEK
ncbi:MAG: transglutaminase-like domain-containing protein, partial [Phycisphaerae bacterium]